MKKKSRIALLSTFGVASVAGVAAGVVVPTGQAQIATAETTDVGNDQILDNNVSKPVNNGPTIESNENANQNIVDEAYGFSLTRTVNAGENELDVEYNLTIKENDKKEGTIFLADENGNVITEQKVKPGDTFYVTFEPNKGYEGHTIRELLVYGKSENYRVPSKKVEDKRNLFSIKLPTVEESTLLDGTNWMYGENVVISIIPSFIVESIGVGSGEVNWEHGTYYEVINGYVYNLESDANWSTIEKNLYETFDNSSEEDKKNPINLFFYLNGHTLTIDKNIDDPNFFPSGWDIHFLNNGNDTATNNGEYGTITASNKEGFDVTIEGTVTFGSSVASNYIPFGDGIKILKHDDNNGWNSTIKNNPNK